MTGSTGRVISIPMHSARKPSRIEWIDYARFFAALIVMGYHYGVNGIRNGKLTGLEPFDRAAAVLQYGYLGVPLFFMISGFVIMSSASSGSPLKFAISRVFRLWPAFIVSLTATSIVLAIWPSPLMPISVGQYLVNLTMIPTTFGVPVVDGVYWTLKTELMFYAAVLVVLSLRLIDYAQVLVEVWIIWLLVSFAMGSGHGFLQSYDAFFAAGCTFFFVYRDGLSPRAAVAAVACVVVGVQVAELPTTDFINGTYGPTLSHQVVIGIVVAFFVAFLAMCASTIGLKTLPYARQIGALTYPMYLLHAHIGYTLMSKFGSGGHPVVTLITMAAVVLVTSWLIARFVERPAQQFRPLVERLLLRPRIATAMPAAQALDEEQVLGLVPEKRA
ncbi:acyltransferase [Mesorhizobium australicum]|uniref:Acyltransferase n=1 Tax=Mesorhizobium australicum TaxID=536018 RepID=A0ACC6T613_9HYPH